MNPTYSLPGLQSIFLVPAAVSEAPTPAWQTVCEAYDEAQETPKIMELSDMWLNLEVTLADIWRGEDASGKMQAFSELLSTRLD